MHWNPFRHVELLGYRLCADNIFWRTYVDPYGDPCLRFMIPMDWPMLQVTITARGYRAYPMYRGLSYTGPVLIRDPDTLEVIGSAELRGRNGYSEIVKVNGRITRLSLLDPYPEPGRSEANPVYWAIKYYVDPLRPKILHLVWARNSPAGIEEARNTLPPGSVAVVALCRNSRPIEHWVRLVQDRGWPILCVEEAEAELPGLRAYPSKRLVSLCSS